MMRAVTCPGMLLVAALAVTLAVPVHGEEWFVAETSSPAYPAATVLRSGEPVQLKQGERVFLYSVSGTTLTLEGPFAGRLQEGTPALAIAAFTNSSLSVGATRAAGGLPIVDRSATFAVRGAGTELTLSLGAIDGMRADALFALRSDSGAELGIARVIRCSLTACSLRSLQGRRADMARSAVLRAMPETLPLQIEGSDPALRARIESLRAQVPGADAWRLQSAAGSGDIRMWLTEGRIWFALAADPDSSADASRHKSLPVSATDEELADALDQASRTVWLLRLAALSEHEIPDALFRADAVSKAGPVELSARHADPADLRAGDWLRVSLESVGRDRHYWVYHIDSQLKVSNFFPEALGEEATVGAGERRSFELDLDASESSGMEHLLALAISDDEPREVLVSHLHWQLLP